MLGRGWVQVSWQPRVMAGYAAWMLVPAAAYAAFPGLRALAWALIGAGGAAAIVTGVALNRPARAEPWLLLAAACASLAASQVGFLIATGTPRAALRFPWLADGFTLAAGPLAVAGLGIFLHWRMAGRARPTLADGILLAAGLAFACWLWLVLADGTGQVTGIRAVAAACPLGDVLILVVAARLVVARPGGGRPAWLLLLGAAGLGASDLAYALLQLHGTSGAVLPVPLGWVLCYAAWGAAALDPAMTVLTEPVVPRLVLLALAALAVPAALLALAIRHRPADTAAIAAGVAAFDLVVLGYLADAAARYQRASRRERELRRAGAAFAAAAALPDVAAAAQAAVSALAGRHPLRVVLAMRDGATLRPVGAAAGGDPVLAGPSQAAMSTWPAGLTAPGPVLVPAGPYDDIAGAWDDQEGVLLCPLPAGDGPAAGLLAVSGPALSLTARAGALEVLARQAALAAERVSLSAQVTREHGRAYVCALVEDTSDAILIVKDDGVIDFATPAAEHLFGTAHVTGSRLPDLVSPAERDTVARAFAWMREGADPAAAGDWLITQPDGTPVEVRVSHRDLRADRMIAGLVLTLRDVSEQRSLQRELAHQAFHDALTGMPNRALFTDRVSRALAGPRRPGTAMAVLVVDLDDFNVVNDTMGHTVGDELLVAAAGRLAALAPAPQLAARLGADEFALLVEDIGEEASVEAFAQRIVEAFAEPFPLVGGSVITTATVGAATTEDSTDAGDLVRHADLALYAAKAAGKRQWRRYRPLLSAGMARRRELKAAIEEAVSDSAFTLAYQPIVVLASGKIAGFEALVRWPHPRWGMIGPDQFITLAEETGHIVPLGSWVLRQAVRDLVTWQARAARPAPLYVSVNVSARQFRDPGFVAGVRQVLAESGLGPSRLQLELTESVLLGRDDRIQAELTELKQLGVRLAIDDFGTGYSSLSYLRELPMDVLKIDKSFTEGIALSGARLALVEVIVRMAKTLGLSVVAEGIESQKQRELLISLGCEFGQGYLLEKPVGADEAEALARAGMVGELRASAHAR